MGRWFAGRSVPLPLFRIRLERESTGSILEVDFPGEAAQDAICDAVKVYGYTWKVVSFRIATTPLED